MKIGGDDAVKGHREEGGRRDPVMVIRVSFVSFSFRLLAFGFPDFSIRLIWFPSLSCGFQLDLALESLASVRFS